MIYLGERCLNMKENILKWVQEGQISFPSVLLTHYKQMNINEEELVLLLHVMAFIEKGNAFPTPTEISARMTVSSTKCSDLLRRLIQKGLITIEEEYSESGIRYEKYSIEPLWSKLINQFLMSENKQQTQNQEKMEMDLYTIFEQEFGRPLSPFECETLTLWLDDDRHEPIIIKAALREAVISGKLNFRYIDRILFEWKKNGIKTIEQAKSYGNKFRQYQNHQQKGQAGEQTTRSEAVPFYNWLEQ